jgi:hypothetical protein
MKIVRRRAGGFVISALAHALALLLSAAPFPSRSSRPPSNRASMKVVPVSPPEDADHPGLQADAGTHWRQPHASGALRIGTLRIDLAKLSRRASMLFPTVVPGLALDAIFPESRATGAMVFASPRARAAIPPSRARSPLRLGPDGVQALIDRTWSRHDRWKRFAPILAAVEAHDGNDGAAPQVLFEYSRQNALQPFVDSHRPDARIWAQIGLAADHVDFIGFIRGYTAAYPNTKSSIELLFLLDQIVQADCDALALFVAPDTDRKLLWTKSDHPHAYELGRELLTTYRRELHRRGLDTPAALHSACAATRLRVLNAVQARAPHGYRAGDARFLMASISWRQGNESRATETWASIGSTDAPVYGSFIARIQAVLRGLTSAPPPGMQDASIHRAIDRVLDDVEMRWLLASSTRLRKFGYTFDSY